MNPVEVLTDDELLCPRCSTVYADTAANLTQLDDLTARCPVGHEWRFRRRRPA